MRRGVYVFACVYTTFDHIQYRICGVCINEMIVIGINMSRGIRYNINIGYCRRHNRSRTCSRRRTRSGTRSRHRIMNIRKRRTIIVRQHLNVSHMARHSTRTSIAM